MYLADVKFSAIVKKQFSYKLKSYSGGLTSLIFIQLIALFFSFGGTSGMGGGSDNFSYNVQFYTGSLILVFTMLWAFILGILITTKAYRNDDYSFVTNQSASQYSSVLFLLSACAFAGVTAFLSTRLFQLLVVFVLNDQSIMMQQITAAEMFIGISGSILYILLFASVGYLAGMLIQVNRAFLFILPVGVLGLITSEEQGLVVKIGEFFGGEASMILFVVKVIGVSGLFTAAAIFLSKRLEVKP